MRNFEANLSPQLSGIHNRARREKKRRFDNLYSLLTPERLTASYFELRHGASAGVDGVTWTEYGKELRDNIRSLHKRLVDEVYRAPDVRRTYIPKANGKLRPLGIPCLEDKIVQRATAGILNSIYEADFLPMSYGYRPDIGAQDAHRDLGAELAHGIYGYVVEADIKGFYDNLDHNWLIQMLEQRIADRKMIRLIRKWLKAGILEPDGQRVHPVTGTPQGGIVSPILANVYLHYALDLWFVRVFKRKSSGRCFLIRYADDFVAGFQFQSDAQAFEQILPGRLGKFALEVEPTKTGMHRFSRHQIATGGNFDFLGFTFRWQLGRSGRPIVARTTAKKKFRASLASFTEWIKDARNWPRREMFKALRRKLAGYWNYYGVHGNSYQLKSMWSQVYLLLFRWLNRSSQRRDFTMRGLSEALKAHAVPMPRITESRDYHRKPFLWQCA